MICRLYLYKYAMIILFVSVRKQSNSREQKRSEKIYHVYDGMSLK